jgi:hypothetical protein
MDDREHNHPPEAARYAQRIQIVRDYRINQARKAEAAQHTQELLKARAERLNKQNAL